MRAMRVGLALLAASAAAAAAPEEGISWPEGSAMHTAYLMAARRDAADAALQAAHARLLATVEANDMDYMGIRLPSALKDEHEAWREYRTAVCELAGAATGAGGTWPTVHALACEGDITRRREVEVAAAVACIEAVAAEDRAHTMGGCLAPLAPMLEYGGGQGEGEGAN